MGDGSWLPVEVLCYALGRPGGLTSSSVQFALAELEDWLDETELHWLPSTGNLRSACAIYDHWFETRTDDWAFITRLLRLASEAVFETDGKQLSYSSADALIAARRRVPESTLVAFSTLLHPASGPTASAPVLRMLESGCSDPHVHQGAAIGFDEAIRRAALNLTDLGELSGNVESSWKIEVDGHTLLALPLIAGIRIAAGDRMVDSHQLGNQIFSAANGDIGGWGKLRDQVSEIGQLDDRSWNTNAVQWKRDLDDSWNRDALLLYMRLETLLLRGLSQQAEGLDTFVATFNRFAHLRKFPGIQRHEYLSLAIGHASRRTPGLQHVDFRLGEQVFGSGLSVDEAVELYGQYFDAYSKYLDRPEAPGVSLTFPLGLIKTRPAATSRWRWDTAGLWRTAESLLSALGLSDAAWKLTDGIDVCGTETDAPNWLFQPVVSRISRAAAAANQSISYRFHAGEWHWNPVNGLRRILETTDDDLVGFRNVRIVNALAFDDNNWELLSRQPIDELLDDLLVAYQSARSADQNTLVVRIEREIWALTDACYPQKFSSLVRERGVDFMLRAYRNRGMLDALERMSNVSRIGDQIHFLDSVPTFASQTTDELTSAYLIVGGVRTFALAESEAVAERLGRLQQVLFDAYSVVRAEVSAKLISINAVVEVCPSSNAAIGTFRGLHRHPVKWMNGAGLPVAIGSDDPSIFHSWLSDEYNLLLASNSMSMGELDAARSRALQLHVSRPKTEELGLAKSAAAEMIRLQR